MTDAARPPQESAITPRSGAVPPAHPVLAELEAGLDDIRAAPRDGGAVQLIVRRPAPDEREVLEATRLDPTAGLVGDDWCRRRSKHTADGSPHPDRQLTFVSTRVIERVAGDRARWPLAGDQLFVDLDLSEESLPSGTRLALGSALVEVTGETHAGCAKFAERFGADALRFVSTPLAKALRLRGVYARVVRPGEVCVGDTVLHGVPSVRHITLRPVCDDDLPAFFEQQRDPVSVRLAAVASRDRVAFDAHWARIRADASITLRTLDVDGRVAGNVLLFEQHGRLLVGYWLGRPFWGQSLANRALGLLLAEESRRPLHAHVAKHNLASLHVLERHGFTICGEGSIPAHAAAGPGFPEPVPEWVLRLGGTAEDENG